MPQGLEASHDFIGEPFALTMSGLYYLEQLFAQATYFSLMVHDTTLFDERVCNEVGALLVKHSSEPKLPLFARNEMAAKFLRYLEALESRELNDGAAGKHPIFQRISFVSKMRVDLERVLNSLG